MDEIHVEVLTEGALDLLALAVSHETVIDEHTHELVADRLVDERSGNRRIDTTAQSADHATLPHCGTDRFHGLLDDRDVGPRRPCPTRLVEEATQHVLAVRRVGDLGVELDAVETAAAILHRRHRDVDRRGRHGEPARGPDHGVAVRHPHLLLDRQVREQQRLVVGDGEGRPAVFGDVVGRHGSVEGVGDDLVAVTDAEHRNPELEDAGVDVVRILGVHGGGPSGDDDADRIPGLHLVGANVPADDLAEDVRLTDAPCDELGVLRPHVEDEHLVEVAARGVTAADGTLSHQRPIPTPWLDWRRLPSV